MTVLFRLIAFVLLSPLLAIAEDSPLAGPFGIQEQLPLTSIHLSATPQSARVLGEGDLLSSIQFVWTNSFIQQDRYTVDGESREAIIGATIGVGRGIDIGFKLPVLWRGGGVLDPVIDRWHSFFGLPRGSRDTVSDDEFFIGGVTENGGVFYDDSEGTRFGNVELPVRFNMYSDSRWKVTTVGTVSLPAPGNSYAHQSTDLLTGLLVERSLGTIVATAGAFGIYYGDTERSGVEFARFHPEGFLYLDVPIVTDLMVGVGLYGGGRTVTNVSSYPDFTLYLDTELKYLLTSSVAIGFLVRENPAPHDSTADVTFALQLRYLS